MSEILAVLVHSGWDEGRIDDALSPKAVLENKKTKKQSLLSQMPTHDDEFAN